MPHKFRIGTQVWPADPFWVQVQAAIEQRAEQLLVELVPIAVENPAISSDEEFVRLVEEVLAQDLDALIGWNLSNRFARRILESGLTIVDLTETDLRHSRLISPLGLYAIARQIGAYLADNIVPRPLGTAYGALLPYQTFRTKSRDIAIGIGSDKLWRTLCPLLGLEPLRLGRRRAERKAHDRADAHARSRKHAGGLAHPDAVDANGREPVARGFFAERPDLFASRIGGEERMVDHPCDRRGFGRNRRSLDTYGAPPRASARGAGAPLDPRRPEPLHHRLGGSADDCFDRRGIRFHGLDTLPQACVGNKG